MVANSAKPPRRERRAPQTAGSVIGTILGVVLITGGLAVVGAIVLFVVAMSQFGSNK